LRGSARDARNRRGGIAASGNCAAFARPISFWRTRDATSHAHSVKPPSTRPALFPQKGFGRRGSLNRVASKMQLQSVMFRLQPRGRASRENAIKPGIKSFTDRRDEIL
jgi:hypothetical protein